MISLQSDRIQAYLTKNNIPLVVLLDTHIVDQVLLEAKKSVGFHGIPQPSSQKTASHVAFWINKHRPAFLLSRGDLFKLGTSCIGQFLNVQRPATVTDPAVAFYVNEHLAMFTYLAIMHATHRMDRETQDACIARAMEEPRKKKVREIIMSMRGENFSARSMTRTLDLLFGDAFEGDD